MKEFISAYKEKNNNVGEQITTRHQLQNIPKTTQNTSQSTESQDPKQFSAAITRAATVKGFGNIQQNNNQKPE